MKVPGTRTPHRAHGSRFCRLFLQIFVAIALISGTAQAGDRSDEFWPEFNLFKNLGPTTRLHLAAAYAQGKESPGRTLDAAGYLDFTLMPLMRGALQNEDWRRNKYVWARVGYVHVFHAEEKGKWVPSEDRAVAAVYWRVFLPDGLLLESRGRVDFRWIDGEYSTRTRLRAELNRDYKLRGRNATWYLQVEPFYDTRYDGWSRFLYQAGTEVELTGHFRVEPYVASQVDRLPSDKTVNAFGLVAKWYY